MLQEVNLNSSGDCLNK